MTLIKLYWEFFKIGLFSIGGGLATLPFLQNLADNYGWLSRTELIDMIAVSESTPGAIGINTATFVGYNFSGLTGGIIATLGIITPSIIIITLIANYYKEFKEKTIVKGVFLGIRPAVTGLIASVGFEVLILSVLNTENITNVNNLTEFINFKEAILFTIMIYLIHKYQKHPIIYLIAASIIGIIFKL